ncbi:DNA translocase FtsK [Candidatus Peregrinibacteria bacterium]|nr:DNA translocase FtsK [Candidatus Peregrinibacteria bacterium]
MSRSSRSSRKPQERKNRKIVIHHSVSGILQIAAGILLFLILREQGGILGHSFAYVLTFLFGKWSIVFPLFLGISGIIRLASPSTTLESRRSLGLTICLLSFFGLVHIGAPLEDIALKRDTLAGAVGFMVSFPFLAFASRAIGYTVLTAGVISGMIIAFQQDISGWLHSRRTQQKISSRPASLKQGVVAPEVLEWDDEHEDEEGENEESPELNIVRPTFAKAAVGKPSSTKKLAKEKAKEIAKKRTQMLEVTDTRFEEWQFPEYDLLDSAHSELVVNDEELKRQAKIIEEKLGEFELEVIVRDARPGPTVTQFTLEPAEGIRLSKIANLKDDLALALAAQTLRIEAPIPGKSLVGIEMPNRKRTHVHLREILESDQFLKNSSSLVLPLGRDVSGEAVVANLEGMPHLLIAGATNSGKSVCINTILMSLLFQNAPHELKLLLIDPKRVELMPYAGIPHLLHPVITEADKALQAFRWAVAEMGRRLHRFSDQGARNIDEYNEKQKDQDHMLPRIIIVIDELADLMMRQLRRDTETMIVRIAQMARAVGMHLIISTQRPSVDVITGLIKANVPSRIAFRTVSSVDSRTILDGIGAEDLLGEGDMLYMTAATPNPVRIQGIYVSTKEVQRVINAVKIAGGGRITEQIGIAEDRDNDDPSDGNGADYGSHSPPPTIDLDADDTGGDDLFFEAVRVVKMSGKASASLLQRQLKVGYARAARLLDIMEERGLIGPVEGAKARQIYRENLEKVGV